MSEEYVEAFNALSEMTAPKCGLCRSAHQCCSASQCEMTKDFAQEYLGETLVEVQGGHLPFLGKSGCIVPPHLRPQCTVHVCEQHFLDPEWTEAYFEVRERAEEALWEIVQGKD